eukprot:TRINITY_DN12580_c0_g1_i1.p1 TRINITY_DN12580_c0_g1~~TRINITY_DN12580_c0_g1_i1.p1  ORF type:complete len:308 (+),score=70.38 TRINITY_DN12580_c0_g1_i1:1-924(+)
MSRAALDMKMLGDTTVVSRYLLKQQMVDRGDEVAARIETHKDSVLSGEASGETPTTNAPPSDAPAALPSSHSSPITYAIAQYAFTDPQSAYLTLAKGDVITVLKKEDNWWTGSLGEGGVSGMFPSNYVKEVSKAEADEALAPRAAPPPTDSAPAPAASATVQLADVEDKIALMKIQVAEAESSRSVLAKQAKKLRSDFYNVDPVRYVLFQLKRLLLLWRKGHIPPSLPPNFNEFIERLHAKTVQFKAGKTIIDPLLKKIRAELQAIPTTSTALPAHSVTSPLGKSVVLLCTKLEEHLKTRDAEKEKS